MAEILVRSELNANVWQILVAVGEDVEIDQELVVLESMKTEIPVPSPRAGRVVALRVEEKDAVTEGQVLVVIEC